MKECGLSDGEGAEGGGCYREGVLRANPDLCQVKTSGLINAAAT